MCVCVCVMCMCGVHVCDVHVCDVVCVHVAYSTSVHDVVCVCTCDVMFILSVRGGEGVRTYVCACS